MASDELKAFEQLRPRDFLEHAVKATSQYDAQYRSMSSEILALRAALGSRGVQEELVEAMQEIILQSVNDAGCCAICGNDIINHDQPCGVHLGMVALNQSAALRGVGTQDKEPK